MSTGKFIVIEGTDGSGKGTHTKLLVEWLKANGHNVHQVEFPRHSHPAAYFVDKYLTGEYGDLSDIGPEKASLFYALDRYDASLAIRHELTAGSIIIADRYVGSNMAHQGGKIDDSAEREAYFKWNEQLEYGVLGIPRPDLNIVLNMPAIEAQKFVDQKQQRDYLSGSQRDIHENDLRHLARAEQTYAQMCELFPDSFTRVDCAHGESVRSIEAIQEDIRSLVQAHII